ncbi:Protein CWC15-like protein A [Acropora cervicornis]|uniref:Protein CWC15-like protein A n=1 Tax=Acropora cervicornis TaxID=6130 RepID=A0AAD9R5V4_ACRCE|nr:Protein CWC15-like protein A [Acropora cervicornis]
MTTAARPTWDTAKGGRGKGEGDLSALSKQYSSRDLPSHTKLKRRQVGQDTAEELRNKDFRKDLEEREWQAARERGKEKGSRSSIEQPKRPRLDQPPPSNLDADDPVDDEDEDDSDERCNISDHMYGGFTGFSHCKLDDISYGNFSDDEDDTAELLAELQRIKKERAQEEARKEKEKKEEEERIRMENIMTGNPLLNTQNNFKVKRRWDDDVVFKNCAKGDDEKKKGQHFINDTLRSEFHKKFMEKYVK